MKPVKNVAASVHQRLLNLARASGRPFNELAQYYALERWLYRLARSAASQPFRAQRGFDAAGVETAGDLGPLATSTCWAGWATTWKRCAPSWPRSVRCPWRTTASVFDSAGVATSRIAEDADYEGVRATFQATLGNVRLPMQIDIGFSDLVTPEPVSITYPTLLGQPAPELSAYNRETAIAEKFEAMVKLGELNSRMKDFFDVWLLSQKEGFRAEELGAAVARTFQHRGTPLTIRSGLFWRSVCRQRRQGCAVAGVRAARALRRSRACLCRGGRGRRGVSAAGVLRPAHRANGKFLIWPPGGPWMP